MAINIGKGDALIGVDPQSDFCPGGSLAVTDGDAVIPVLNALGNSGKFSRYVLSQDWHPKNHRSFAANNEGVELFSEFELEGLPQTAWPVHCVQDSLGAAFHPDLELENVAYIQLKGMKPNRDSYSAFNDNGGEDTGFAEYLRSQGITRIFVAGLATDYCVKFTAIDGAKAGFEVWVITDACRGIGDEEAAYTEMVSAGCNLCTSDEILSTAAAV